MWQGQHRAPSVELARKYLVTLGPTVSSTDLADTIRRAVLDRDALDKGTSVVVDLPEAELFSVNAARALIVPWLEHRVGHDAVAIRNFSPLTKEAFDVALEQAGKIAYWIPSGGDETPQLIGAASEAVRNLVTAVREQGHYVVGASTHGPSVTEAIQQGVLEGKDEGGQLVLRAPSFELAA